MSDELSDLKTVVAQLVEKQTLSLAGAEAANKLREQNEALRAQVGGLEKKLSDKDTTIAALTRQRDDALAELAKFNTAERAMANRESKMSVLETASSVAAGKVQVYQELTQLIFRNAEIHKSVNSNRALLVSFAGGGSAPQTVNESETTTERVE